MSELECRVVESEATCLLSEIGSLKPLHQVGVSGTIRLVGEAPVTQNNIINRKKILKLKYFITYFDLVQVSHTLIFVMRISNVNLTGERFGPSRPQLPDRIKNHFIDDGIR